MFPATSEAIDLFNKNYRQTVEIIFYGQERTITITEKDILSGGLVIDRYSTSGSKIELGSASASELQLDLKNTDGKFDDVTFEGAELFVRIGIKKYDAHNWEQAVTQYVPCGYFTVDEPPRKLKSISISALDRMVLFDKPVDWSLFTFPMTLASLISQTCHICNVTLATTLSDLPNYNYIIPQCPTDETTYRQIIQWAAEMTASCAFMDWEGKLRFSWYSTSTGRLSPSERYSSDMYENDITISGVQIADEDSNIHLAGDDGYAFLIENNSLIQSNHQVIAEAIYAVVGGFSYRPYECTAKPAPYLYPLDIIEYVDKDGVSHDTIVTNVTYTFNSSTSVKGQGETETANGMAAANPLTKRESLVIKTIKNAMNETLNGSVQSILAFNELITNALGVYSTVVELPDGSKKYYMHDNKTLQTSSTIYTMTDSGFAFTNAGWNGGNPVWQYGFSKDGNVIAKKVNAYGIEVSDPASEYSSQITPGVFSVWYRSMQILTVNGDESVFTKIKIETQAECGRIRILPHSENGVVTGTNLIFTDE